MPVIIGGADSFAVALAPGDTAELRFESPDLCPICASASPLAYIEDTLLFYRDQQLVPWDSVTVRGEGQSSPVAPEEDVLPTRLVLITYPNPVNSMITVDYNLPLSQHVTFELYDLRGQRCATQIIGYKERGQYSTTLNLAPYPSGTYFFRMVAGKQTRSQQIILLK